MILLPPPSGAVLALALPPYTAVAVALALVAVVAALVLGQRLHQQREHLTEARTSAQLATREGEGVRADLGRAKAEIAATRTHLAAARADLEASQAAVAEAERLRAQVEERAAEMRAEMEDVRRREEQLREELRSRDAFLATIAHELRTPLNAIIGWGHVLRAGTTDETTRARALDAMIRNADQQARLISDLLDLSRVQAGTLRLDVEQVEVTTVVRAALDTVRPAAERKGVALRSSVDADAGPLRADPHRLQQVVCNLLVNAVKFTPEGGEVKVVVERDGAEVELRVSDTGPGVPAELIDHVFDPFRQGAGSPARVHGSLGLGLAIVRQLVETHGGRVVVRNNDPEPGTTFVVRVPLNAAVAAGALGTDAPLGEAELPSLEGVHVLVVGEDAAGRELVSSVLRGREAIVSEGPTLDEAMGVVKGRRPDVVLCDGDDVGDPPFTLIGSLRARPAQEGGALPAVAVSSAHADIRVRALLAGYQGHIAKPVHPEELVALVATLTDRVRNSVLV